MLESYEAHTKRIRAEKMKACAFTIGWVAVWVALMVGYGLAVSGR